MKPLPAVVLVLLLGCFTLPVDAKNKGNNKKAIEQAQKEKAKREKEREERKQVNEKIKDYLESRDKNKDNQISKDEFLEHESDKAKGESTFNEHNKNKDRVLNKKEIQSMLGLD